MAICIGDQFPLGRNAFYYVMPEGPYTHPEASAASNETDDQFATQMLPATNATEKLGNRWADTHAIAPLSVAMSFEQERSFTETAQGTRARVQDRVITGKSSATFTVETYLDVGATATGVNGPDIQWLLKSAIGDAGTPDANSTVKRFTKFFPAATGNCLQTFNLARVVPDIFSEQMYGCVCDSMTLTMASGDPIKVSFTGSAYNHVQTGVLDLKASTDYSSISTSTDLIGANITDVYQMQPGTEMYDGTNDASSLTSFKLNETAAGGYAYNKFNKVAVTAYQDEDAGKVRMAVVGDATGPGSSATERRVVPFFPLGGATWFTTKPLSSTVGSVKIQLLKKDDATAHASGTDILTAPITSFDVTVANNIKPIDDQAFTTSSFSGFIPGFRDVTGTVSMRVKSDVAQMLLYRRELFRKCLVTVTLGNVNNQQVVITMSHVEFEPSSIDVAGQDEMTVSMPFKSMVKDTTAAEVIKDFELEYT